MSKEHMVKLSEFKKVVKLLQKANDKVILLAEAMCDIRSELTCSNADKDYCIDKICIALDKVTPKEQSNEPG